ncbi:MAG: polyribonucleotide nucleotidyltransferase [Planctomycetota bacterium]
MPNPVQSPLTVSTEIAGRTITIETGRMARQAAGAVTVRLGDTVVLSTVTAGTARPGIDFFPLTVDYRESTSAAGRFPGGFFKREGRPTTKEILVCRCIDRPCRPLFAKGYKDEVSIANLVISADAEHDPDIVAMIGSSAALAISGLPWNGPIGSMRVGRVDGELVLLPTYEQRKQSDLDLVMAATSSAITMVEAGANELGEDDMLDALFKGDEACKKIAKLIEELVKRCNVTKQVFEAPAEDTELKEKVFAWFDKVNAVNTTPGKHARTDAIRAVRDECIAALTAGVSEEQVGELTKGIKTYWEKLSKEVIRRQILDTKTRSDGRDPFTVRPIDIEVGVLPRTHGSTIFTRGETQALVTMTLGTVMDDQRVEGLIESYRQKFMLHYNFPSYCVGEAWPNRGPKRREIGHGALAERALAAVVPDYEEFPYTIRIRSDITESNGSSSMASVCGGTLALMDGGVKIRRPVAGIAMGLVSEGDRYVVLSDILGSEDHCGDMDFKVAGTQTGITALQMDIKLEGVSRKLLTEALAQARQGRIHILKTMLKALQQPRAALSSFAPQLIQVPIDPERIGALIGPGGKTIRKIQEETLTKIEIDDERNIVVIATTGNHVESKLDVAESMVRALASEVELGTRYTGRVVSVRDFGCFVEVLPGLEGLVHVSELADGYVEKVTDVVNEGDEIDVVVIEVDPQGRIKLSKKRADPDWDEEAAEAAREERGDRGGRGRGGDRGGRGRGGDRGGRGGRGGGGGGRGRRERSHSSAD